MTPAALGALVLLNLVGAASPGPDVILITRQATRSRSHALATVLGIHVGVLMWVSITVLGATALLTAFPQLVDVVQVVGGIWLVWMGQAMVRGGLRDRSNPPVDMADSVARLGTLGQSFRKGLATNLANPKIVLFLAALIAPALPADPSPLTAVTVILTLSASSLVLFSVMATLVSTNAVRTRLLRAGWLIDVLAGAFFILAGCVLVGRGVLGLVG